MSYHSSGSVDGAVVWNQTKNVLPTMTGGVRSVFRLGNMEAILVYQVGLALGKMLLLKHFSSQNAMF